MSTNSSTLSFTASYYPDQIETKNSISNLKYGISLINKDCSYYSSNISKWNHEKNSASKQESYTIRQNKVLRKRNKMKYRLLKVHYDSWKDKPWHIPNNASIETESNSYQKTINDIYSNRSFKIERNSSKLNHSSNQNVDTAYYSLHTKSNSIINNNNNNSINNVNESFLPKIFLPSIYTKPQFSLCPSLRYRETPSYFLSKTKQITLWKYMKNDMNDICKHKIMSDENDFLVWEVEEQRMSIAIGLLEKYIETFTEYGKYLKTKIDSEENLWFRLINEKFRIIQENQFWIDKIEKLKKRKYLFCQYKLFLFLMKVQKEQVRYVQDETLFTMYGLEVPWIDFEKNTYYDNRNDKTDMDNYIEIYNPEIMTSVEEFSNILKTQSDSFHRLLKIYNDKIYDEIPQLQETLQEHTDSLARIEAPFQSDIEWFQNQKKKKNALIIKEKEWTEEYSNLKETVNPKTKYFQVMMLINKLIQKKEIVAYSKELGIVGYGKTIREKFLFLEKFSNLLMDKDNNFKDKNMNWYTQVKYKYLFMKNTEKNKKKIEEFESKRGFEINKILNKTTKLYFLPRRKINIYGKWIMKRKESPEMKEINEFENEEEEE